MSRPVKNERHAAMPPTTAPYSEVTLGTIDPSGYSASDVAVDLREYGYGGSEPTSGGVVGAAGACSTPEGLGMTRLGGVYAGGQHAQRPVPLEYQADVVLPHAGPRVGDAVGAASHYGETY